MAVDVDTCDAGLTRKITPCKSSTDELKIIITINRFALSNPVYTIQSVIKPVVQPGLTTGLTTMLNEQTVRSTGCQTWLYNRLDNGFDNRLYRVNGASVRSCPVIITPAASCRSRPYLNKLRHSPLTIAVADVKMQIWVVKVASVNRFTRFCSVPTSPVLQFASNGELQNWICRIYVN